MMKTTLERAYELARSGPCRTVEEVRRQLTKEKYDSVLEHLGGHSIQRQLNVMLKAKAAESRES
jgi:hypothetical protein